MEKLKLTDALQSTTMFLVDNKIEDKIEQEIQENILAYKQKMADIDTLDGLSRFISSEKESIFMLETLLGISGEKMKRVVSMLRLQKGYTFDSEWSEERIQKELTANKPMMEEFCELMLYGVDSPRFKELMPYFILQDFKIDETKISRLSNVDFLRSLIKARMIANYTTKYSQVYERLIKDGIEPTALAEGLICELKVLEGISNIPCYVVTDGKKRILVTFNFQSTTSNNQNKYADNHVSAIYASTRDDANSLVVNILDGAGWVGRSLAYKSIYRDCDYFLNLRTIGQMNQIIENFFN